MNDLDNERIAKNSTPDRNPVQFVALDGTRLAGARADPTTTWPPDFDRRKLNERS